jgi:hypothetical protein
METITQENKELLLKDLCARLPYGVKVLADCDKKFDQGLIGVLIRIEPYVGIDDKYQGKYLLYQYGVFTPSFVDEVRPYLFPLSSMTEEQRKEYESLCIKDTSERADFYGIVFTQDYYYDTVESIDYLYKNHIDIRGLIPKGLAIDATGLNIY